MEKFRKSCSLTLVVVAIIAGIAGTNDYASPGFILLMIAVVVTAIALAIIVYPGSVYAYGVKIGALESNKPSNIISIHRRDGGPS